MSLEHGELTTLFSRGTSREGWTGVSLKDSARQFHQVLYRVFESRAIIPFRFPTLMGEAEDLTAHMRAHLPEYLTELEKFRTSVQMDMNIAYSVPAPAKPQTSGKEYLLERQKRSEELDRMANQLREHGDSITRDWRTRRAQHGLKVSALLERDTVVEFNQTFKNFAVAPGLSIRISGPWPVTEFLEITQGGSI